MTNFSSNLSGFSDAPLGSSDHFLVKPHISLVLVTEQPTWLEIWLFAQAVGVSGDFDLLSHKRIGPPSPQHLILIPHGNTFTTAYFYK